MTFPSDPVEVRGQPSALDAPTASVSGAEAETVRAGLRTFSKTERADADCFVDGKLASIEYFIGCTPEEVRRSDEAHAALDRLAGRVAEAEKALAEARGLLRATLAHMEHAHYGGDEELSDPFVVMDEARAVLAAAGGGAVQTGERG